jgi:DTW domain-containing protein YfiP
MILPQLLQVDGHRAWCMRCRRAGTSCLCSEITTLAPRTKFVFLTHPKEARKIKNGTGRLAHLSLQGSELLVGVDFDRHPRVVELLGDSAYDCRLLYPAAPERAASRAELGSARGTPVLFVLDGTWPMAKKMMRRSVRLHGLPRVSADVALPSAFRIKQQPDPACLATIEAVDRTLLTLAALGVESYTARDSERLLRPFHVMNEMSLAHAADPGPKKYGRRGPSKRSERRKQPRTSSRSPRKVMFQG